MLRWLFYDWENTDRKRRNRFAGNPSKTYNVVASIREDTGEEMIQMHIKLWLDIAIKSFLIVRLCPLFSIKFHCYLHYTMQMAIPLLRSLAQ